MPSTESAFAKLLTGPKAPMKIISEIRVRMHIVASTVFLLKLWWVGLEKRAFGPVIRLLKYSLDILNISTILCNNIHYIILNKK